jgi:hypothetical protein
MKSVKAASQRTKGSWKEGTGPNSCPSLERNTRLGHTHRQRLQGRPFFREGGREECPRLGSLDPKQGEREVDLISRRVSSIESFLSPIGAVRGLRTCSAMVPLLCCVLHQNDLHFSHKFSCFLKSPV